MLISCLYVDVPGVSPHTHYLTDAAFYPSENNVVWKEVDFEYKTQLQSIPESFNHLMTLTDHNYTSHQQFLPESFNHLMTER